MANLSKTQREEFIRAVCQRSGLDAHTVERVYLAIVKEVLSSLSRGLENILPDFGKFSLKTQPPKTIKMINSGEIRRLTPRKMVKFYPNDKLKEYFNQN